MTNRTTITLASIVAFIGIAASVGGQPIRTPAPTCQPGFVSCPDYRTGQWGPCNGVEYLQKDRKNCGKCGNACREREECEAGKCVVPNRCGAGNISCPDAQGVPGPCVTVDYLQKDDRNCGRCGNRCKPDEHCVSGKCAAPNRCGAGSVSCPDARGVPGPCVTVDYLQRDDRNCGRCGNACKADEHCVSGTCAAPNRCGAGSVSCLDEKGRPGACRSIESLKTDMKNCGRCGNSCREPEQCVAGSCVAPNRCGAGSVSCLDEKGRPGPCVPLDNLQRDQRNCGACGHQCKADERCEVGKCIGPRTCAAGTVSCLDEKARPGPCVPLDNLQRDRMNCGACGHQCRVMEQCEAGKCVNR